MEAVSGDDQKKVFYVLENVFRLKILLINSGMPWFIFGSPGHKPMGYFWGLRSRCKDFYSENTAGKPNS